MRGRGVVSDRPRAARSLVAVVVFVALVSVASGCQRMYAVEVQNDCTVALDVGLVPNDSSYEASYVAVDAGESVRLGYSAGETGLSLYWRASPAGPWRPPADLSVELADAQGEDVTVVIEGSDCP